MRLDPRMLGQIVREVIATRPDEAGCRACFEQLERFAEMHLVGMDAAQAMPFVQEHLRHCVDCQEEFQALLTALSALSPAPS